MSNARTVKLHIGEEKTGTTSIQSFMRLNRGRMRQRGILYPKTPGDQNHFKLVAYAGRGASTEGFRRRIPQYRNSPDKAREEFRSAFLAEVDASDCGTVLLSNEHCHSRLLETTEIETLRELFAQCADEIQVYLYVRRQDELALSHYSTLLKTGVTPAGVLPELRPHSYHSSAFPYYFDHWAVYNNWAHVFGSSNVHVRVYERGNLLRNDVISDFLDFVGAGTITARMRSPEPQNKSLDAKSGEFMYYVNKLLRDSEKFARPALQMQRLLAVLEKNSGNANRMPTRVAARAFYDYFAESNERLRTLLFPDRERLFSESFDMYPELDAYKPLSVQEAVEFALLLWKEATREPDSVGEP